jgi:hypothetical protein
LVLLETEKSLETAKIHCDFASVNALNININTYIVFAFFDHGHFGDIGNILL